MNIQQKEHQEQTASKMSKKQRKKQKQRQKIEEGIMKPEGLAGDRMLLKYTRIPRIATKAQQQSQISQKYSHVIYTGRKKLEALLGQAESVVGAVISSSSGGGKLQLVGAGREIPKTVSLAQRLKSRAQQLGIACGQSGKLGRDQDDNLCISIELHLGQ